MLTDTCFNVGFKLTWPSSLFTHVTRMSTLTLPIDCSAIQSSSICIAFSNYLTCLFNAQNRWIASWRFALAGNFPEPIDCLSTHAGRLPFDRTVPAFLVTNFWFRSVYGLDPVRSALFFVCAILRFLILTDSLLFLLCESFSQFAARKPVPCSCSRSIKKRLRIGFSSGVGDAFHFEWQ